MTIDPFIFTLSIILGFPIGMFFGVVAAHYIADKTAERVFDSLLTLRATAKRQMERYEAATKTGVPSHEAEATKAVPKAAGTTGAIDFRAKRNARVSR